MKLKTCFTSLAISTTASAALLDAWHETTEEHGIEWFAGYSADAWTGLSGDKSGRLVYTGLLEAGVELDLETLIDWQGAIFHNSWLWLSGEDPSEALGVDSSFAISNIAGRPTFRMFQLWLEQSFAGGAASLRLGMLAADEEFAIADSASWLLNGAFGWPAFLSENLPNGGPAYPLSAPGIRLQVEPAEWGTFRFAAFAGDPGSEDSNRSGFQFDLNSPDGVLMVGEMEVRWQENLPGTAKFGGWVHTDGDARHGIYAIMDQTLVDQGISIWSRVAYRPGRSAEIRWSVDGGVTLLSPLPGRPDDTLAAAIGFTDADSRNHEFVAELTYEIVICAAFSIQPGLQYLRYPDERGGNEDLFVLGTRATIVF